MPFRLKCDILKTISNISEDIMDVRPNDILVMKKKHPCGENKMLVLRSGMDFKLRCVGCGREFMTTRAKAEKNIKNILRED